MAKMSPDLVRWYMAEGKMLDKLYEARSRKWRNLAKAYDLDFKSKIRDLKKTEYVKVSEFYPLVRQVVATVAMNYPTLFFEVLDDEADGEDIEVVLERAASSLLELTDLKPEVHQSVVDALFCSVGWVRVDYNPPGEDQLAPYAPTTAMAEDLPAFSRRPPGLVHVDPMCAPQKLASARYIRERVWMPLKVLRDDESLTNRDKIQPTTADRGDELGWGEPLYEQHQTDEQAAVQEAVENGEFVLVDQWHTHWPVGERRLVWFAPGIDGPIKNVVHPFARRVFPTRPDPFNPMDVLRDEDGEPIIDLETLHKDGERGEPGVGWLCESGFPFIPVKFDLHPVSFYPLPHLAYMEDIQNGIVEWLSREAAMLKRFSRQGIVEQAEIDTNPKGQAIVDDLRLGEDGQWHVVASKDHFDVIDYGGIPTGHAQFGETLRFYGERISQVADLKQGGGDAARTATEAALVGAAVSINREWMETAVSDCYVDAVRAGFTMMGDPRYTPENFIQNVSPDGQQKLSRALTASDFLWNYRVKVQAGSMQPLFEEMQKQKSLEFFDRAIQMPEVFDPRELAKFMASAFTEVNPDKLMIDDVNQEALHAQRLENEIIVMQMTDPGVVPGQDHNAHMQALAEYQQHPTYQQLQLQAQQMLGDGVTPAYPIVAQQIAAIDAAAQQHQQAHLQAQEEQIDRATSPPAPQNTPTGADSLIGEARSFGQKVSNLTEEESLEQQQA